MSIFLLSCGVGWWCGLSVCCRWYVVWWSFMRLSCPVWAFRVAGGLLVACRPVVPCGGLYGVRSALCSESFRLSALCGRSLPLWGCVASSVGVSLSDTVARLVGASRRFWGCFCWLPPLVSNNRLGRSLGRGYTSGLFPLICYQLSTLTHGLYTRACR